MSNLVHKPLVFAFSKERVESKEITAATQKNFKAINNIPTIRY
jgi:hypothetical protein